MAAYLTLVASLPHLPHFERATRLPINRERLEERLKMLTPEDREVARRAEDFLRWQRQPIDRSDEEVLDAYHRMLADISNPTLRLMIEYRMERRTLQAALRRRQLGQGPPGDDARWGLPRVMQAVRRNWSRADFGLGAAHPWIWAMKEHLESGDALGLERLLMRGTWRHLGALMDQERPHFSFEAVLVYLFQWDILSRWVAYEAERASERFDALVDEAMGEHVG